MSDYTVEERLDGCFRGLLKNSIFMNIALLIMFGGFAFNPQAFLSGFLPVLVIGTVWGFPALKAFFFGGFGAALTGPLKADYEVVTVDGAGNRISSDGGTQSVQGNFVMRLFMLAAVWCIAMVLVTIHVFYLSIKGIILYLRAKAKPSFIKSPIFIIIVNIAVYVFGTALMFGVHVGKATAWEAGVANLSGKTLTVYTSELNLRSEPSGTSRIIKTLKRNEAVTAAGNVSGFWVPVTSGSDSGYTFASSLIFNEHNLQLGVEFPFLASVVDDLIMYPASDTHRSNPVTLARGSEIPVFNAGNYGRYFGIEYRNGDYHIHEGEREKLNFVRTVSFSAERPAEFDRDTPFNATVTEDIVYTKGSYEVYSIPAGARVTVTGGISTGYNWGRISQARVTYEGTEPIYVHWKYLRPVN